MALAFTALAAASQSTSNIASYAGTVGTPVVGDLLICFVSCSGNTSGTMSGTFTWTLLTSIVRGSDTIYVFWAYATTATATSPTFNSSSGNASGCIISCVRVTGGEGSKQPYLRQLKLSISSNANPSITMDAAILTGNGVLAFASNVINSATQWVAPTGLTEVTGSQVSYNTPANSGQTSSAASGVTASSFTWTNGGAGSSAMVVLEFYNAGTGPVQETNNMGFFGGISSI